MKHNDCCASISVVAFDLDGTLIDSMPLLTELAVEVIERRYGLSAETARQHYLSTSGLPFQDQLALLVPRDREHAAAVAEFERRKVALLAHLTPTEGTLRALASLRDAGCRLAVSSNARQVLVDRFVRRCGLAFDVALGWSHGLQKGRSHFHEICRRTACTIDSLLFVGDSIVDGRLAADAGVSFAARLGTFTSDQFRASWPDVACVTELEELLPWIEQRMPVRRAPMRLAPGR